MKLPTRQRGLAVVEFSLVATTALVAVIGLIEIGRVFFTLNALEEATRRGARVAAVCAVNDAQIANIAIFSTSGTPGVSSLVGGLTPSNVVVEYLNDNGTVLADPIANYGNIAYVRVRIANLQHRLLIPIFFRTFTLPAFATTLPRESLGVYPTGVSTC